MKFRRLVPSNYGRRLNELVRKQEPGRALDRLLVAALIEARSCERFALLRDRLKDAELAEFYGRQPACNEAAASLRAMVEGTTMETIFAHGLHEFLTEFIARNNIVSTSLSESYNFH